jgi:hypothetical protein
MPTLLAVLGISGSKGRESPFMNRTKVRGSQIVAEVENFPESVGRHRSGVRENETLLLKPCGAAYYLCFERPCRTSKYIASLKLSGNHLTQLCEALGWDTLLRLAGAVRALREPPSQ